jgi:hypothetical protein
MGQPTERASESSIIVRVLFDHCTSMYVPFERPVSHLDPGLETDDLPAVTDI